MVSGGPKMDIVVKDLNIPYMVVFELMKELRKLSAFKFSPILMITTESALVMNLAGKYAGATGWIV
jgi:two-component system chemotaxis response regulator CheY